MSNEVAVAGRFDRSLADFERACVVLLGEEQERPNPDNALIGVLCDAVRLARERPEQEIAEARADRDRLQEEARVPGAWVCDTCGFRLQKMHLRASDGAVGVDRAVVEDICANDGTSLRPLTWKEDAEASDRVGIEHMKRADAAEGDRDRLRAQVEALRDAWNEDLVLYLHSERRVMLKKCRNQLDAILQATAPATTEQKA